MILHLRGRRALSDFRLAKLLQEARKAQPSLTLRAEYWHFVECESALDGAARQRLEQLLTYGPEDGGGAAGAPVGELLLVAPRPGKIGRAHV